MEWCHQAPVLEHQERSCAGMLHDRVDVHDFFFFFWFGPLSAFWATAHDFSLFLFLFANLFADARLMPPLPDTSVIDVACAA